jgi:hypothetical protein
MLIGVNRAAQGLLRSARLGRVRTRFSICMAVLALSGCSLGGGEEAKPARGAPSAVAATMQALDQAIRARDFRGVCNEIFSAAARRRAGGADCERLLRSAAANVRRPRIHILAIRIERGRATVRVRTTAAGQRPLVDEVELVREGGGYRVSALAG